MRSQFFIISLLCFAVSAHAQFDEKDITPDSEALDAEMAASEPAKLSVDNKDIKALSDAKASHSEEGLVRAASRILGVDPTNLVALNALGVFYFEQGKNGLARIIFNRALVAHADEPALHNNLGVVYLAEGKQRQALTELRKALDLKNDYRVGAANLGAIFLEYKDYGRALGPMKAGYSTIKSDLKTSNPVAAEIANNYAVALAGSGKFDDAREVYEAILKGSARNSTVLLNYAILLVERVKDYKEGSKIISRVKFAVDDNKVLKRIEELEEKINAGNK